MHTLMREKSWNTHARKYRHTHTHIHTCCKSQGDDARIDEGGELEDDDEFDEEKIGEEQETGVFLCVHVCVSECVCVFQ